MCYFNWLGHPTRHFNVGNYRRRQAGKELHDASFFDPSNAQGIAARQRALIAALDDMEAWLEGDGSQVAIFDATNTTNQRRSFLRDRLHNRVEYMFLESVCNDPALLEKNYRLKMQYSPDYAGMDMAQALADFKERIQKYESVYETITDRTLHYVKLIDMVTGRGHMDVNRISGYIPGKMVFYLMQICKALGRPRRIWLTRHGESMFNVQGKIGGNSSLSIRGAAYTQLLPVVLASRAPMASSGRSAANVAVWTSTLSRTIETASLLPFPKVQWKALDEIQAGICDGMTYAEIKQKMPEEHEARKSDKLRYRYPSGESYMDVIQRLEPVVIEAERDRECVCIVAHQAVLRVLYGYFMNRPLEEVPRIEIPLHTLMELTPKADGTMAETRFKVDVDKALKEMGWIDAEGLTTSTWRRSTSSSSVGTDATTFEGGEDGGLGGGQHAAPVLSHSEQGHQHAVVVERQYLSSEKGMDEGVEEGFTLNGTGGGDDCNNAATIPGSSDEGQAPSAVMRENSANSLGGGLEAAGPGAVSFRRSISMAELAAAELVVTKKMPENRYDDSSS